MSRLYKGLSITKQPSLKVSNNYTHTPHQEATKKPLKSCSTLLVIQFSSVFQSYPTVCDPVNRSMPGLPVHHQLPEFTQTQVTSIKSVMPSSHLFSWGPAPVDPGNSKGGWRWREKNIY